MELTTSALTAVFVGMIWALIKVVEYFVSKSKKTTDIKLSLSEKEATQLEFIYDNIKDFEKYGPLTEAQINQLNEINKNIQIVKDMHEVYSENRVPIWYVPNELLPTLNKIYSYLKRLNSEFEANIDKMEDGQSLLVNKMIDLMATQKLMVERLGDLIVNLNNKKK